MTYLHLHQDRPTDLENNNFILYFTLWFIDKIKSRKRTIYSLFFTSMKRRKAYIKATSESASENPRGVTRPCAPIAYN